MSSERKVMRDSTASLVVRLLLLILLGVAVLASVASLYIRTRQTAFADPILQARMLIKDRFVREVDDQRLQMGAVAGMIAALDDPYSFFVEQTDTSEFHKAMLGEYVGIGVSVELIDGVLTVVTPLDESPALKAGVRAGDEIVRIDDADTKGMTLDDAAAHLTGAPGTNITIIVNRKGDQLPITITRAEITTQTVKGIIREGSDSAWRYMLDPVNNIAYIRITQFNPTTSVELRDALEAATNTYGEIRGLIIDLRSNPGGILDEAVAVADDFLDRGTILSTKGRGFAEETFRAREGHIIPSTAPIAVLIDGQSASASEILSGTLVESKRAIAVGERTFGKGSVQGMYLLPSEKGEIKLTEQLYYLPSGRTVQKRDGDPTWGVDPSPGFAVPLTEEHQILMRNARERFDVISDDSPIRANATAAELVTQRADPQLSRAYEAVLAHVTTGIWPEVKDYATSVDMAGASDPEAGLPVGTRLKAAQQYREFLVTELSRMDLQIEKLSTSPDN
ncbi:MAG: S41 family peptidase [Phycisphaeraceae bacterium]|nr:S41 family peptidase [Phycisphaerales bacterium]MCB9861430.1 S41 family peptidase [Phycisphaeraceae bacterium]